MLFRRHAARERQCTTDCPPAPFVVGVGRSGTTLLRLMLDAHPEMAIPPETGFIPALARLRSWQRDLRRAFFRIIVGAPTWPDFDLSAEQLDEALRAIVPFDVTAGVRSFYRLYAGRFGKPRWGDKTPDHGLHLADIRKVVPEARFIHVIRDGRDVALSMHKLWFAPAKDLEGIVGEWARRVRRTRRLGGKCPHYFEVRYEDLVERTTEELKRTCDFLELPYDARMERYYETAGERLDEVKTRHKADGSVLISKTERLWNHRFTSVAPDSARVFRYRREMSEVDRVKCERKAGDLLEELGYERSFPRGRRWARWTTS